MRLWLRTLRRRSQKDRSKWADITHLVASHWPKLEIRHPWPDTSRRQRVTQRNPREEPDALAGTSGSARGR